ncbi:hypothetical protein TrCOL_g12437 [Triparma columacea]|nr:hypothetical protein TrCOL_g12437 [Triparma columacea]
MGSVMSSQSELGFADEDIDDVRRLIADTSMSYLGLTVLASILHLLFECLSFKEDVDFWRSNDSLRGLSVRQLVSDFTCQAVILLFLIEQGSSVLVVAPSALGLAVAGWKVQRSLGLRLRRGGGGGGIFGWSLAPTRTGEDAMTSEADKQATRVVGRALLPLILGYAGYSLGWERHVGWYSYLVKTLSGAAYGLGFVMMTPQLFLNYKLKSVSHLPWRFLCYRFVSTFIDDLFAFVIRMPVMTRLSCFRDDLVFAVFLWQRWNYRVDMERPYQGDGREGKKEDEGGGEEGKKDK